MSRYVYHPHRRDNHSYYGATWATSQHRRARRIWRRVFRGIVVVMCMLMLIAAVAAVPIIGALVEVTGGAR